jgi:tetraacyldisaccharide 4'-kinase
MEKLYRILLYPLSCFYGLIIWFRNLLFDLNIRKANEFKLPVISIGNITVGGTGKTPHTEYLIRLLKDNYKVAFLSRGYKRNTNDFRIGNDLSTVEEIGDEPFQILGKFPWIVVAVDRSRVNGIRKIQENYPETDIILLDDAFQHRSVKPGVNILLIDYNRPIFNDSLLPGGRLREPASERRRADIIIVTKMPANISAIDKRLFLMKIGARDNQSVYFTSVKYADPKPVFPETETRPDFNNKLLSVLLVTGIANAGILVDYLKNEFAIVEHLNFPDHHFYSADDMNTIVERFQILPGKAKVILTTEKDAVRLRSIQHSVIDREFWYYLPIEIEFQQGEGEQFNSQIIDYVSKNNRNSLLYKEQN